MSTPNRPKYRWQGPESSPAPAPAPAATQFKESAGVNVDADEEGWRRLTGDGLRDLAPLTHERMLRIAHYLWETNLLANRLIEVPVAYLLAQGVTWRINDEDAQTALDAHWNDGLNAWDLKIAKRVRELSIFGEQCYPVFRNQGSGFIRLGYLDPALIETVVTDPDNREQPIGIVTRRDTKGVARRYRIIVNVPESAFTERTQQIRETFTAGDCFYFRVNDLSSATRGRSDLLAQMDWLDAYDQFLFGEIDRAAGMRAYMWDVTLTGASPEEVEARAKKISAPRAGAVRVHNDAEAWKAESPTMNAYDASLAAKLIRNHVLGGATMPEHWYGGADTVNRATGDSMTEPTEKMLDMRQAFIGYMLKSIAQFVLRSTWNVLAEELTPEQTKILNTLHIEWPELTMKDTTKYAAALQQAVASVAQAMAEALISRELALRIVSAVAQRLGVEIDVDAELEKAQKELEDKGGDNLDGFDLVPGKEAPKPAPAPPLAA